VRKFLPWLLTVGLVFLFRGSPMGWIFPMALGTFLLREKLARLLVRWPLWLAFPASGLVFGQLTECFAILQNWNLPPDRKILLHPNPLVDLLLGFFYYLLFALTWYLLLRRVRFSKGAVFLISGLFGLATEQGGAIVTGLLASPVWGSLMALFVMSVYGAFPALALLLSEARFPERRRPAVWHYPLALFCLFVFWVVFGIGIYRPLISVFPK